MFGVWLAAAHADDGVAGGLAMGLQPRFTTTSALDDDVVGITDEQVRTFYPRFVWDGYLLGPACVVVRFQGLLALLAHRDSDSLYVHGTGDGAGRIWDESIASLWAGGGPHGDHGGVAFGGGFDAQAVGYGRFSGASGLSTSQRQALQFDPGLRVTAWTVGDGGAASAQLAVLAVRTTADGGFDGYALELETPMWANVSDKLALFASPIGHLQAARLADDDPDPERIVTVGVGAGLLYRTGGG